MLDALRESAPHLAALKLASGQECATGLYERI